MSDDKTCLNCGEPFKVKRNYANRNADIRYCVKCKDATDYIHQTERVKTNRRGSRGSRVHLASN